MNSEPLIQTLLAEEARVEAMFPTRPSEKRRISNLLIEDAAMLGGTSMMEQYLDDAMHDRFKLLGFRTVADWVAHIESVPVVEHLQESHAETRALLRGAPQRAFLSDEDDWHLCVLYGKPGLAKEAFDGILNCAPAIAKESAIVEKLFGGTLSEPMCQSTRLLADIAKRHDKPLGVRMDS